MYLLVDCDNCYVSCERVFQPELAGKPVVVLSNNDGCVVSRSAEAKALGIKMGVPVYQIMPLVKAQGVELRSSNYELYADLSNRIMSILRGEVRKVYVYSIDEAFLDLDGEGKDDDLRGFGLHLVQKVQQWVGIPISIGIAPTKTLCKVAAWYAKHYAGYHKVCAITDAAQTAKALAGLPLGEVWGIGRRYEKKLHAFGVLTAYDLTQRSEDWVRRHLSVTGVRTWRELHGEDCIPIGQQPRRQTICTSRSFPRLVDDPFSLEMYVSNYAARCAAKLRREHSAAQLVTAFASTNPFLADQPQLNGSLTIALRTPSSNTFEITEAALRALRSFCRPGLKFKRAGVIVSGITADSAVQTELFDTFTPEQRDKFNNLSKVMDSLNHRMGADTLKLAVQQLPHDEAPHEGPDTHEDHTAPRHKDKAYSEAIRRQYLSPIGTTKPYLEIGTPKEDADTQPPS